MPRATIADLDRAKAIVVLGVDAREQVPVLHLRLRRAVVELGVPLVEVGSRDSGLTRHATAVLRHEPGGSDRGRRASSSTLSAGARHGTERRSTRRRRDRRARPVRSSSCSVGHPLAESADATVHAASLLVRGSATCASSPRCRRGNVHGALDLGLAPGFLPGRVTLDAGRRHVAEVWGDVPERRGQGRDRHPAGGGSGRDPLPGAARLRPARRLPRSHARAGGARRRWSA